MDITYLIFMLITVLEYVAINRHTVTNTTHVSHTPAPRGGGMALLLILESSEAVAAPHATHGDRMGVSAL